MNQRSSRNETGNAPENGMLKTAIKRVPVPFCGVMLAVAALGTLLEPLAPLCYPICAALSCIMLVLVIAKIALFPHDVKTDLDNPVLAGVAGTFPMALMNLATYLARLSWHAGFALWIAAVALHFALIVRFTVKFSRKAKIADLTPAYFVIYIGMLAASTTAPVFHLQLFGLVLAYTGFAATILLVVLVSIRIARAPLPEPLRPMMCIYAAPPSMCLAAYLSCASEPSLELALVLSVLGYAFYIVGLIAAAPCLRRPFYPTFAAMTFPLVIAAAASSKYAHVLASIGNGTAALELVALLQIIIAVVATVYVTVRYVFFLFRKS